jgi:hypothetical protein
MHKVQMNSSASDTIRARVARFNEFDNGHVLFDYQKMTEEEFEERAKAASIKDPNDVYYIAIDDIMNPSTDVYWFQGKSYDYAGAEKALSDYQKSTTSGLNSGRKPLNSSEEQVKISGIVTIYSDFIDFKRSVSEHLLQTAVGARAKLKFKWVGDNKVEVSAICSVADARKVKILLENSDVTKTVAWNSSANSNRKGSDKAMRKVQMNSSTGITYPNGMPVSEIDLEKALDYNFGTDRDKDINSYTTEEKQRAVNYWVKKTDRMLNSSAGCDEYVELSTATLKRKLKDATSEEKKRIQAELNARGVYPKKSVNSSTDGYLDVNGILGVCGDVWTYAELAAYWDEEHMNDPVMSEYASFEDWVEDIISNMVPLDSSRKLNSANDPESPFYTATDAANYFLGKDATVEQIERYLKRKGYSDEWIRNVFELMNEYADEQEDFDVFNSSHKNINSNRKVGNSPMRKVIFRGKLNSSRKPTQEGTRKKLNSSEEDAAETEASTETEVQDTGVDGGDDAAETADLLEDALIVQNPETKEVSLFVATEEDEPVPPEVDVIAEVTPIGEADVLDSSRRFKNFATAKLNSSKDCLNSDADVCPGCGKPYDECECEPGTVAYDEIQLPDDTIVEVENIVVVKDDDDDLGLFMPETADEVVPEGYEVVAVATPTAEADVLDSSRRMKKSNAKKLNSKKR